MRLCSPLVDNVPRLRISILDTLLDVAGRNIARGVDRAALFEQGLVARPEGTVSTGLLSASQRPSDEEFGALYAGTPKQPQHIGVILVGRAPVSSLTEETRSFVWPDVLGIVPGLVSILGARVEMYRARGLEPSTVKGVSMPTSAQDPSKTAPWHLDRVARVLARKGRELMSIAFAGGLHPAVCKVFGLPARSCAAEIDLSVLLEVCSAGPTQVRPMSTSPAAREDAILVISSSIPMSHVEQVVHQGVGLLLEDPSLFDVFEGKQLGEGKRSFAFALRLRATDHAFIMKESARARKDVAKKTEKVLGAALRS